MTTNSIVKTVNCSGINMIACQSNNEILVGIKSVCDGLGIDYSSQLQRINRDEVVSQGVVKITIPSEGGEQKTNMLIISFLPFFLTGIKSKMVRPEIQDKIIEFKLKAKDVLAQAFLPHQAINQTPLITQPQSIPSSSDVALYYLSEAMKSLTFAHSNTEKELSFIKEFANEQCMSFGYDVTDLKCDVKELSETINNNCGELEDEIQEIQMMTDAHTEDIQEMKDQIQYLLDWRIETIDELINNHNAIYSLNNTVANLNTDFPIINKASKIALLCDQDYRAWVNTRINDMAKTQHRWTGRIRNDTYRTLEQCGYKYLTNRCNLTQIVYGNWKNIRLAYALVLLGAIDELNLISA